MRVPRIRGEGASYYHVISRTIDREFLLDDGEKERFRKLMRKVEGFSGVDILTYTILDNHWHIDLFVPEPKELSDEEFLGRLACLYDPIYVKNKGWELQQLRERGDDAGAEFLRARYIRRMHDVSEFTKTLKQRFTQSYNGRHKRRGPLWEDRFKSVLAEAGSGSLIKTIAGYIDLNAVRAGIVEDPKDYRFCGYAEAVAGDLAAQRGIQHIVRLMGQSEFWPDAAATYRQWLYTLGEQANESQRKGLAPEAVKEVVAAGGKLSFGEVGRCKARYLTDGVVLGSKIFVQDVFQKNRRRMGAKRQTGARLADGAPVPDLYAFRVAVAA